MSVLVTGCAGFIGFHVARLLLERGESVIGLDDLNDYYSPALKRARLDRLEERSGFRFVAGNVCDPGVVAEALRAGPPVRRIVHLAAQAGVRHSLADPGLHVRSNVLGHVTLLEAARHLDGLEHVVFASSSSVYGLNERMPFAEVDRVDRPNSVYAASKRSGELMAHAYGQLYGIPQTGLRFFTVYGPWGRPDMAYYAFALAIAEGRPLTLYDEPELCRDFTYIHDVADGVLRALALPPDPDREPVRLVNLGNHRRERVSTLVTLLEQAIGRKAVIALTPKPPSDLSATWASVERAADLFGWHPTTSLEEGVPRFVAWLREHQTRAGSFF